MSVDAYAYTNAWRDVNPAEKALFAAACLTAAVLSRGVWVPAVVVLCTASLTVLGARVPGRQYVRTMLVPASFLLWSCAALAIALPGATQPAGSLALPMGFAVTPVGLDQAASAFARSAAALSALLFLALTTPMTDIIALLRRLRVPSLLLDLMTLVYRQIFIFGDIVRRVHVAQASRLGHTSWAAGRRSVGLLGGHLLVATFDRTRNSYAGLLARGYEDDLRYLEREFPRSGRNLALGGVVGALLIAGALLIG